MPIAFGNELNSSIDHDEFSILGDGPTGRWFLEVRRPAARVKNRARRRGARHSSRPRKHGVEDRCNQDRGDDKRGEGHHSSSPSASNLPVLTWFNAAMNALCIAVGWWGRRRRSGRSGHPGHRRFDEECARAGWRALTRRRKAHVEAAHEVELAGRLRPATAAPFCYDRRRIARPIRSTASLTASGG
jgi:hypothetical protein